MIRVMICVLALVVSASSSLAASRILVASRGEKAVKCYDGASYELKFSVAVPGDPHDVVVSADGRSAYTADFEGLDNTVSFIDLETGTRASSIKMTPQYKPHGMVLTRDGKTLYVTCEATKAVVEIDVPTQAVTRTIKLNVDNGHLIAMSPDEHWLFVTSQWDNNVSIIDRAKGTVFKTIATGKGAEGVTATPDGKELWVVNRTWQTLAIIDLETMKKITTMSCEHNPIRAIATPDNKSIIVSSAISDEVAIVDRTKRAVVDRIKVGDFPVGLALTKDGSRLYVTNMNSGNVSVIDLPARKVVHTFAVGAQPEGIAIIE